MDDSSTVTGNRKSQQIKEWRSKQSSLTFLNLWPPPQKGISEVLSTRPLCLRSPLILPALLSCYSPIYSVIADCASPPETPSNPHPPKKQKDESRRTRFFFKISWKPLSRLPSQLQQQISCRTVFSILSVVSWKYFILITVTEILLILVRVFLQFYLNVLWIFTVHNSGCGLVRKPSRSPRCRNNHLNKKWRKE